ncbi:putative siderophore transport system permease protein YfiZ [Paraconexibacter sp. AEG42_29]|uniref:Siderophore transport system permease protein YfiZ n=1 Tax=Paraconexibacter sp. AEG42_29 TaxID=2997339 RepID=A0AAU7AUH6_9ACTN
MLGLLALVVALAVTALLSIAVGSRGIAPGEVWRLLWHPDGSDNAIIVHDLRIPRTVLGLLVGSALGVAGGLMQALTRNPIADPGLLGVNAGASAAVVSATAFFGITDPLGYVWFGFLGAAAASVVVYVIGTAGRSGATPVRLALAGTAVTFALYAYVQGLTILDREALDQYRFWQIGALAGHPSSLNLQIAPFIVAGLLLAFALGRPLNALGLGDETGRALGLSPNRVRILGALSITLLCGAATAAAGPIVFIGLTVPHVVRAITGPDQRWVLPYCAVLAPVLLLGADVIGRIVTRPGELEVGIVSAVIGAPVFIAIVRRRRIAQL